MSRVDSQVWLSRPGVWQLLEALDAADGKARFVGGAVRDLLLGEPVHDLDLATSLAPQDVTARLEAVKIKAVPTGLDHGTVTAVSKGNVVEVTTLRSDVSTDGRRASVAFTDDWAEDAARRDFTINALYADPLSGEVHDYHGGLADLAARRVRFIGAPEQRIAEDHLRILRYFRFLARLGGAVDEPSLAACTARANDLMALSRERIADETLKLLALPDPSATVRLMVDKGIFAPVLPEIGQEGAMRLTALIAHEKAAEAAPSALRRLAALLPADAQVAEKVAARLKLSNHAKAHLKALAKPAPADATTPIALAYRMGAEVARDRLLLSGHVEDATSLASTEIPRLPIKGGDLIARGVEKGPLVARTLRDIETRWIAAGFPTGDEFENLVKDAL